ncbi:MAG TPA: transcriptional regulator [Mycobacterium sp.]
MIGAALMVIAAAPAQAANDEDQVRAVLDGMNASYNGADFAGFASHLCTDMRRTDGFEAAWYESRRTDGPTSITVMTVDVAGVPPSRAVANVRFAAANRADPRILEVDFIRESAEWKACRYGPGLTA